MPASAFDSLSDGSELTGDELNQDEDEEVQVKRTPSKNRKRVVQEDDDDDEEEEEQVDDLLDDDDEEDEVEDDLEDEDDEFKDELAPEPVAATKTRKPPARSSKPSPLKVKLRRSDPKTKPTSASTSTSTRKAKIKWKPRTNKDDDDEEEDVDQALSPSPEDSLATPLDEQSPAASDSDAKRLASTAKTARQLAKENKESDSGLLELPMTDESKKRKLTDAEIALRRSETARKRRNQTEKKLEDDKIETINRLLKKQVGRSRNKLPRAGSVSDGEDDNARKRRGQASRLSREALKAKPAPFYRYINSATGSVLAVPTGPPLVSEVIARPVLIEDVTPASRVPERQAKYTALLERVKQEAQDEEALAAEWGEEGIYEFRTRAIFDLSRKEWIADRKKPEPEKQEPEPEVEEEEEEEDDDEDEDEDEPEEDDEQDEEDMDEDEE